MFNKIAVTTVSAAVLFGGAFQTSTDASASIDKSENQAQQKSDSFSQESLNSFLNKYFGNVDWNNVKNNKQATETQEKPEPKQEKQQTEQQEQPSKQADEPAQTQQTTQQQEQSTKQQENQNQNQSQQLSNYEQKVVELTNQERTERGLSPLKISTELSKVAREKSRDMAENNYFSHNSPTYGSPFDMMKQFGITYKTAGENIARGQSTPQEVVNGWMNSEGHRENILNSSFTHIGVGYVENGNYWTQQFIGK